MQKLLHISEALSIAIHVCLWIATDDPAYQPSAEIAQTLGFSYHHFAKVIQRLVREGILETVRGAKGGIRLAQPAADITLLRLYEATGGAPLKPHRCLLDPDICDGRACSLGYIIEAENNRLHDILERTTLAGLSRSFDRSKIGNPAK